MAHLRPRTNTFGAVTRVRHAIMQSIHRFFDTQGFCWVNTPIITASDCEGAGQMFRVSTLDLLNLPRDEQGRVDWHKDFFGRESYLTVSGQLNVEAYCLALSKVYTFGPTFRAENSNTARHLAEFWMIEPEIAFADLAADADLAEAFLKSIYRTLLTERADDLAFFEKHVDPTCRQRLTALVESTFARMDYGDAIKALEGSGKKFEFPVAWGMDMQAEHERFLTEEVIKGPVAVMNYPKDIKAFYMRQNDDGKTVAAMDVLAPGIGEIIGGSQREERLDVLDARMDQMGLPKHDYGWYRDLRRYGTVPHAGFGLGFERAIQYATGIENIRDVILPYKEIEDKPTEGNETEGKPTEDKPTFGERDFRSIKRSEINALHASLSKTPAAANSVLGTISSLFTWIYEDRELPDLRNPAFGIERFPLKKRERFLTPEERADALATRKAGYDKRYAPFVQI